tara:strand:+ start:117 stop:269 length:153 start_codon:yes stop_codon:yes gene_type:complete
VTQQLPLDIPGLFWPISGAALLQEMSDGRRFADQSAGAWTAGKRPSHGGT